MKNLKYTAVGILVGYIGLYVFELSRAKLATSADSGSEKDDNSREY